MRAAQYQYVSLNKKCKLHTDLSKLRKMKKNGRLTWHLMRVQQ